ncbi:MAG: HupE/UreJ family protein [Gammaproteobacteria bacterium]
MYRIFLSSTLLLPLPVLAHGMTAEAAAGLFGAFMHPLSGFDHLAVMLGVGICAAWQGGTWRWRLPVIFLAAMSVGALAAMGGIAAPAVELGIAASLMLAGLAVALHWRPWPAALVAAIIGGALCHGHAHGSELLLGAATQPRFAAFLAATALLHGAGLILGVNARRPVVGKAVHGAGAAAAAAGAWLLVVA